MIIQIPNPDYKCPLQFINTDHIIKVTQCWDSNEEGTEDIIIGARIRLSDGSIFEANLFQYGFIEHYLKLQYLKDSAEVCGKLGIEEAE